ncbi:hypothetical protein D3C76_1310320 [compost metagenome]
MLGGLAVSRTLDQMQTRVGCPGTFCGNGESDRGAFVDKVPGADIKVSADDRLATLEGIGGSAGAVEKQRCIERAELAVDRRQVGLVYAPDIGHEEYKRHPGRVGWRRQGNCTGIFRLPQVFPTGWRLFDFLGVVGQAQ